MHSQECYHAPGKSVGYFSAGAQGSYPSQPNQTLLWALLAR